MCTQNSASGDCSCPWGMQMAAGDQKNTRRGRQPLWTHPQVSAHTVSSPAAEGAPAHKSALDVFSTVSLTTQTSVCMRRKQET